MAPTPSASSPTSSTKPVRMASSSSQRSRSGRHPPYEYPAGTTRQTFSKSTAISVAVDPVALITTECISVTSAMRKHARWAHSSVSAILGGGAAPGRDSFESSRPASPRAGLARKGRSARLVVGEEGEGEGEGMGLAGRWGLRGKKGRSMQDNPLMSAFAVLRRDLAGCKDIRSFDTPALLHPFLQVIRSSSTSAPITSLALIAITKFFAYNLISRDSPRLSLAMQLLSSAITHCRFEASDSSADDIVLLRILKLMEDMISGPGGDLLGDESVCEMMETGLSMCCQNRLSELLRRSAEISMVAMCQVIFERLKHLESEAGDELEALEETTMEDMNAVKMDPTVNGNNVTSPQKDSSEGGPPSSSLEKKPEETEDTPTPPRGVEDDSPEVPDLTGETEVRPYSLPSIRELFRVLVDLLDPDDKRHTDTMRVMALRIIDVALEVAGPSITKHPSLANMAKDHLCRYLFQLVRSDNMAVLHESLRVAGTLLATCRGVLKLQQELFLSYLIACLHPKVEIPREPGIDPSLYQGVPQNPKLIKPPPSQPGSGRATPVPVQDRRQLGMEGGSRKPEAREAMIESVGALARIPTFMVELFVNYDCEVDRIDLCEDMVGLLSRNAFPDSATWSTTNVPPLCLDALLGYVQFIAERLDRKPVYDGVPDQRLLKERRARKRLIVRGTTKFNENPKAGIAYLASQGIIEDPNDPICVTSFLKGTTRVSKKMLGEYISKRGHEELLTAFLDLFDFDNKRVDVALREFLESFRLPGEAPLISRIVTAFADKYCANSMPDGIVNKDAVFVLTYAIIMLNTDQHNANLKPQSRMTPADFAKNLRGVNGGQDFAPEYLQEIYDSIKTNEILLPEEHDDKNAFDHAWRELLLKTETSSDLFMCDTNIFDADMFAATWKPVVATLSYVFLSASDDAVFSRVVSGFNQCATIAARYDLTDALDHIVYCLSSMSTLASDTATNTALNTEIQVKEHSVMVSELAVKLGRDFKAQLATVVLFRVVTGNEILLRDSWKYVVRIWLNLFINSLIPPFFETTEKTLDIPPIPLQNPSQVIDRGQRAGENGLFSTFASYLSSYAADEPPEPSDEELDSTLSTIDCVNSCFLGDVFANVAQMPVDSLRFLVASLLAQLPQDSPAVIVVKPETPLISAPNGHGAWSKGPSYDPMVVYILEFATILTLRDDRTVEALGKDVGEALQAVIRNAANVHPIVVSRATFYLLSLLNASHEHSFIRAPVVLHAISSFDESTRKQSALPILRGLAACLEEPGSLRNEMTNSPDLWAILKALASTKDGAQPVFDIVENITVGTPSAITADNYEAAVSILNDYASAGAIGSQVEQMQDKSARRGKSGKAKPTDNEVVTRGVKAVTAVYQLTGRVQSLISKSHLETNEAWAAYWSPIFQSLTTQCINPCREIRQQAFSSLQRSLLSPELAASDHTEWTAIFGEVLFPLIVRLLKPEVYQSDPRGMGETRVRAATLLCRIFLHYLVLLSEWEGMLDLWLRILELMDRLLNSGQGDLLEEAVPESIKNILLVMSSGGYLVPPPQSSEKDRLWTETWKRLDRFLPRLFAELYPEEAVKQTRVKSPLVAGSGPAAASPAGAGAGTGAGVGIGAVAEAGVAAKAESVTTG